jgi:hypothetical protein
MTKLSKIFIILLVGILLGLLYGIYESTHIINNLKAQVYQSEQRADLLSMTVVEQDKQIKDLQLEVTAKDQWIEQLQIDNDAYNLFASDIKSRYLKLYSYAQEAELILRANGIEFYYTELPVGE